MNNSSYCTFISTAVLCLILILQAQGSSDHEWDYLVYTQQWPQSSCIDANNSHHVCKIWKNITTWTIHGLWPNKNHTEGPNYCNNSAKFDPEEIMPLKDTMMKFWPNLYLDTAVDSFWEHEWVKHGTCAASLPLLRGERNYFSAGLKLNRKYDMLSAFKSQGITPDAKQSYEAEALATAVHDAFGHHGLVRCIYDEHTERHMLAAVEMCVDKTLALIDCPRPKFGARQGARQGRGLGAKKAGSQAGGQRVGQEELCPDTKPIYYTPIQYAPSVAHKERASVVV